MCLIALTSLTTQSGLGECIRLICGGSMSMNGSKTGFGAALLSINIPQTKQLCKMSQKKAFLNNFVAKKNFTDYFRETCPRGQTSRS